MEDHQCEKGLVDMFGQVNDHVTIEPGDSISLCPGKTGDLQYNVVIRPNDTIIIPSPKVGEYYIGGHMNRAGVYSLTGRQITLKQAIISAGIRAI